MNDSLTYKKHWRDSAFVESFRAFKNYTLQSEKEFAIKCADVIASNLTTKEPGIFEIGVGNALVTDHFLTELQKTHIVRSYRGIDVSPDLVEEANERLKEHKIKFFLELEVADATTYTPNFHPDLILALNSWYGIPFERTTHFLGVLKPHGILAILLNSELNLTIDVTNKFKSEESVTSSEQLMSWLDKGHYPYTKHLLISDSFSRANFLTPEGVLSKAHGFFSYILRGDMSRIAEIGEYMQDKPDPYFQLPQHLILVEKP